MAAHFELFSPGAFLCFVDSAYDGTVEQILRLRTCPEYNSAPIVVVAKEEAFEELLKNALEDKYEVMATLNGLLVEKILATKPIDMEMLMAAIANLINI